jgi:hypothetical protein
MLILPVALPQNLGNLPASFLTISARYAVPKGKIPTGDDTHGGWGHERIAKDEG